MIRKPAIIPFITAGDPDLDATLEFMKAMAPHVGAIELGIPFSDPMADGPTIQKANVRALKSGTTLDGILDTVKRFKAFASTPVVLMTYYNPVYHRGVDLFLGQAAKAGVDALIVVDLPLEEAGDYREACERHGVKTVFLAAPNTPDDRLKQLDEASTGYVYLVSRYGTTGARESLPATLGQLIGRAKTICTKPLAVGFGIATPEHAREVVKYGADGVIVGSALVRIIEREGRGALPGVVEVLAGMNRALNKER